MHVLLSFRAAIMKTGMKFIHCFATLIRSSKVALVLLLALSNEEENRLTLFRLDNGKVLEYRVLVESSRVSPYDLATSWRAYQGQFCRSTVRRIPDVSIDSGLQTDGEVRF
ncbi:hypothetical protein HN51_032514 [Arachis hypogaea]